MGNSYDYVLNKLLDKIEEIPDVWHLFFLLKKIYWTFHKWSLVLYWTNIKWCEKDLRGTLSVPQPSIYFLKIDLISKVSLLFSLFTLRGLSWSLYITFKMIGKEKSVIPSTLFWKRKMEFLLKNTLNVLEFLKVVWIEIETIRIIWRGITARKAK